MDEKKLKSAFTKIKGDMSNLSQDIATLRMQVASVTRDGVQPAVPRTSQIDIDSLVKNLEIELQNLNSSIKGLNTEFLENVKVTNAHTREITKCKDLIGDLDEKIDGFSSSGTSSEDVRILNSKFGDFQELINEKLTLEVNQLRLEFMEEIAKVFDDVTKWIDKNGNKSVKKETLNAKEKADEEEEYEVLDGDLYAKKDGKLKRAVKWLFVDDEGDELQDIKGQVKNKLK